MEFIPFSLFCISDTSFLHRILQRTLFLVNRYWIMFYDQLLSICFF